ncbi:MAG: hypothetical protein WKG07_29390 [Hymenobacter sp.]
MARGTLIPSTEHADHLHHDEHEHEHHDQHWLWKYVFAQDHKQIAKQFLITGMLWAILGGMLSSLFRLQLGRPEATLGWLAALSGQVGKRRQAGPGVLPGPGDHARHHHGVLRAHGRPERARSPTS